MNRFIVLGVFAVTTATALGVATLGGLSAQTKAPGAYVIIDISEITDAAGLKAYLTKTGSAMAPFGGHVVAASENIVPIDGTPPKRFAIIAFDSMDKAKVFDASAAQQEINAARRKTTKSRSFIVEGPTN
jgi:uncharacterized protein (DUF1330 family)